MWLKDHPLVKGLPRVDPFESDVFGVELEVDMCHMRDVQHAFDRAKHHVVGFPPPYTWLFTLMEEPSLAAGCELVLCPLARDELAVVLPYLLENMPPFEINERCSAHVHMNALDLSWEEVKALVYLYVLFEPFLYTWVGRGRETNAFAVPMSSCPYDAEVWRWGNEPIALATRYLGLNVRELVTMGGEFADMLPAGGHVHPKGTLEFRHFHGLVAQDLPKFIQWLDILGDLKNGARRLAFTPNGREILYDLNANSRYIEALRDFCPVASRYVFEGFAYDKIVALMERSIMMLKATLAKPEMPATLKEIEASPFMQVYRNAKKGRG